MIRDLFLDLDDTLLDFGEAERHGIIRTLRELGIAPTEETLALYSRIPRPAARPVCRLRSGRRPSFCWPHFP